MPTAILLGGSGLIGRAVARRLIVDGWEVTIAARHSERVPADLSSVTRFAKLNRQRADSVSEVLRDGADLLVDCVCFTEEDAKLISPHTTNMGSTVMLSSKAVYVDSLGNHINSLTKPVFDTPIRESNATVRPGIGHFDSAEGYGSNKVAAETELLSNGNRVSVLRASKVHGEGARPPRTWVFAKRVFDGRAKLFLRNGGMSVDHTSAAANIAALVSTCAQIPGSRVLNAADPDAVSVRDISRVVAQFYSHTWEEVEVEPSETSTLGATPWDTAAPIILDMSAATSLGYKPVGAFADTVRDELVWLDSYGRENPLEVANESFGSRYLSYQEEDAYSLRQ